MENPCKLKTETRNYSQPSRASLEVVGAPEYMMGWHLNNLCNFQCEYCFCSKDTLSREHPDCGKYSQQHIAKCFDDTGKMWRIHMSGGETFLYPRFVELAEVLTEKHYISINTNLSTPNVYEFADVIPPEKVLTINAALHIMERNKRKGGQEKYIDKFLYLQDKGFDIRLEYVTYPPLFHRLVKDIEHFRSQGIKVINLKIFRGTYRGKLYPESYTNDEKLVINSYAVDTREISILEERKVNFFGMLCSAGKKSFRLDVSGQLTRCATLRKEYGNFFTGKYYFGESPVPCPVKECGCSYEGMRLVQNQKGSAFSIFKERVLEEYFRIRPLISRKVLGIVNKEGGRVFNGESL